MKYKTYATNIDGKCCVDIILDTDIFLKITEDNQMFLCHGNPESQIESKIRKRNVKMDFSKGSKEDLLAFERFKVFICSLILGSFQMGGKNVSDNEKIH